MADKGKPGKAKPSRKQEASSPRVSRRDMLLAGGAVAAFGALPQGTKAETAKTPSQNAATQTATEPYPAIRTTPSDRPYNVVLFISDEEAYHLRAA